ncbi:ubiquitin-conjugating enzyme 4 [Cryptococcus wingfieldii CBS 7118]|uniref:Ubiquitin-conjugating enzyme 4 n=1 Tax=Cryptococcus wingfieldii CBS 7118 TaxID=1295528 RepID=A0A1E3J4J7_9TREE|nr:ubiquitin-conjugating enzyme 4 [Cryptococcus wingfieldii CBS 7118]ODN95788.1 ubiquitin-conjugating enzyme 4 [Cryptococcus wingfieldii CBS 7118]
MSRRPNVDMATKRIKKEIADLAKEDLGNISLTPDEANILHWKAILPGPAGSPYEGGMFDIDIKVPHDYPFSPPSLLFMTKVYHCNVSSNGNICESTRSLLKTAWSPALSLYKVILSLSSLLTDPNPADPLVPPIAKEYKSNRKKHDETAREWVRKFAQPKQAPKVAPKPPIQSRASTASIPRRAISRPIPSSESPAPPAQIAGTRRGPPIELGDSEDEGDIEVVQGSSRVNGHAGSGGGQGGGTGSQGRGVKRAKTSGGGNAGDAIVIDE